jgi:hypothetical protein
MKDLVTINHELVVCRFFEMIQNLLSLTLIAGEKRPQSAKIPDRAVNCSPLALMGHFEHFPQKCLQYSDFCK